MSSPDLEFSGIINKIKRPVTTYGIDSNADVSASKISYNEMKSIFISEGAKKESQEIINDFINKLLSTFNYLHVKYFLKIQSNLVSIY